MRLFKMLNEYSFDDLTMALFEGTKGVNNIVNAWAEKLKGKITKEELQGLWDLAKKEVGTENYAAITGSFKKKVTSIKGVTKKEIATDGATKFNYKVRTQQSVEQALDGKPAPKSTNKAFAKKIKTQLTKINAQMKLMNAKPTKTKKQKEKLAQLRADKKALKAKLES